MSGAGGPVPAVVFWEKEAQRLHGLLVQERRAVEALEARLRVTDEMVWQAWRVLDAAGAQTITRYGDQWDLDRALVRAALEAALNGGGEGQS